MLQQYNLQEQDDGNLETGKPTKHYHSKVKQVQDNRLCLTGTCCLAPSLGCRPRLATWLRGAAPSAAKHVHHKRNCAMACCSSHPQQAGACLIARFAVNCCTSTINCAAAGPPLSAVPHMQSTLSLHQRRCTNISDQMNQTALTTVPLAAITHWMTAASCCLTHHCLNASANANIPASVATTVPSHHNCSTRTAPTPPLRWHRPAGCLCIC